MGTIKSTTREYPNGAAADTTTFAAANGGVATWVQIIGAGSTVVVDEDGHVLTLTTDAAEPVALIPGRYIAFTSTTATRVRMGRGLVPRLAVPSTAVPATASALGGVELSVAPLVAATPIAVGANDVRVGQYEVSVDLSGTDGSFPESTVAIPGIAGTITGATLSAPASITQDNTNYLTFTLGIRDGAGGAAATVASQVSKASGASFLGFRAVSLGAITNATTTATSQLTFKSVISGSGQPVTGTALLRVTFTTP